MEKEDVSLGDKMEVSALRLTMMLIEFAESLADHECVNPMELARDFVVEKFLEYKDNKEKNDEQGS